MHALGGSLAWRCQPAVRGTAAARSTRPRAAPCGRAAACAAAPHHGAALRTRTRRPVACRAVVDPWSVNPEGLASQLFALSLFPYLGFLYQIKRAKGPGLTFFGFCFLLVFVIATIPAGIYAKTHYGTSLANVDWLHGGAESLLTITNFFIVLGLRRALCEPADAADKAP